LEIDRVVLFEALIDRNSFGDTDPS